jgi:glycosyltransferase involved in cell wall biosynthesis
MKIIFIHNFHQKFGGDDTVVKNYVAMLRRRGHSVELYQRHNDEILGFGIFAKIRFFIDTVLSLKTWRDLNRLIPQFQPDLIFVHGIYPLISPSVYDIAWMHKVPVVQMVHDMRFWCPMAWFFRSGKVCTLCSKGNFWHSIRYRCYRNSLVLSILYATSIFLMRKRGLFEKVRLFIIPSEHIRKYLIGSGILPERIALHPHIVAAPKEGASPLKSTERYVAFLGRLSPEKGLMLLMRAAERFPDITFKIGGTGPMEEELCAYVQEHKLLNVQFCGFLSGEDKEKFLQKATLLAVPSECYESFGQVVVEAYAAGTPVIAANHGGLASLVVDGETGWLFWPGIEEDFCAVLQKALDFPNLGKICSKAWKYFENNLSESVLIAHLEQSLEGVVKK